mgnify:FL=1
MSECYNKIIIISDITEVYMNKIILAYNFTPQRLQALKLICMMLKAQCRPVSRQEMLQPVGYLAGIKTVAPVAEQYTGDEGTAEMLFLCGFDRPNLDKLLTAIRKSPLQQVKLKAMLTAHNLTWNGLQLIEELTEEHNYMTGRQQQPEHASPKD